MADATENAPKRKRRASVPRPLYMFYKINEDMTLDVASIARAHTNDVVYEFGKNGYIMMKVTVG